MSKAILVLDEMPEKCEDCQFHRSRIGTFNEGDNVITNYGIELCRAENPSKPIVRYLEENKPEWCPLREVPEKIDQDEGDFKSGFWYQASLGWNGCLDVILREDD